MILFMNSSTDAYRLVSYFYFLYFIIYSLIHLDQEKWISKIGKN